MRVSTRRRSWWVPLAALVAVALALPPRAGARDAYGYARLVSSEPVHEFGSVDQGTVVRHAFRFLNAGSAPLEIARVASPCGCTAAIVPQTVIPTGEEGTVEVSFDTTGFRGRKAKSVFLHTNDPLQSPHAFVLAGDVVARVVVDPPVLYLGRIHPASGATGEVRVVSTSGDPLRLAALGVDRPGIRATVEALPEAGEAGRRIVIGIAGELPRGPFNGALHIPVEAPQHLSIDVPVVGNVAGDLLVQPSSVTVGMRRAGLRDQQRVRLRNLGAAPIEISGVSARDLPLEYAVRILRPGFDYQITLRLTNNGTAIEQSQGAVHIFTTHPEEPEVVVPVYTRTRPGTDTAPFAAAGPTVPELVSGPDHPL